MKVNRIITNIESADLAKAAKFYGGIFGLDLLMDLGWIRTYGSDSKMRIQISISSEGGSGTPVPDLSIEVDDLESALKKLKPQILKLNMDPKKSPGECVGSISVIPLENL